MICTYFSSLSFDAGQKELRRRGCLCMSVHVHAWVSRIAQFGVNQPVSQCSRQQVFLVGPYVFTISAAWVAFTLLLAAIVAAHWQCLAAGYLPLVVCVMHAGKIKFYLGTRYPGTGTIPRGSTNSSRVTKWKGVVRVTGASFPTHLAGQKNLSACHSLDTFVAVAGE